MKIINSNIFQVIYYYYYLLQYKINGGLADFMAYRMIAALLLFPFISGILEVIFALIYKYWIGLILAFLILLYLEYFFSKNVYDTGLFKKIIRKKPKILNSHFLSILFVVFFTAFSFFVFFGGIYLSKKIERMGICLIK